MAVTPKAFISYSWDDDAHKTWVHWLATRLRTDGGVDVTLDQWHAVPGDMLPEFMENSIRSSGHVLIICTPNYRQKSDARKGGVGYEGDIMTGEVYTRRNMRKFLPVLRIGDWNSASPEWLLGKFYIDLRDTPQFESHYQRLLQTLHGVTPLPPPIGPRPDFSLISESLISWGHSVAGQLSLTMDWLWRGFFLAGLLLSLISLLFLWTSRDAPKKQGAATVASVVIAPLSSNRERLLKPKDSFRECNLCPEMVVMPSGKFIMGSPENEPDRRANEGPQQEVAFTRRFAVGRFSVTFEEWDTCEADGGCNGYKPSDQGWGRGRRPVIGVSWNDAKAYVTWLSAKTGKEYRLPSDAEREYFTRAGTSTPFWWGSPISPEQANYNGNFVYDGGPKGQYRGKTVPVETFAPNPWGLFQVHGNVFEWVEDCFDVSRLEPPTDGSARTGIECTRRTLRGGSWYSGPAYLRSASRYGGLTDTRNFSRGFRAVRTLTP
jgi:formylglycine-generating enzyme required for sulfatase activity